MGAYLAFQIDKSSETDCQNNLVEHERPQWLNAFLCSVFILMPNEEVDEYVEDLNCDYYND